MNHLNEIIGNEFNENSIKFFLYSILDCNIGLSNEIIEYFQKNNLKESIDLKQLLNNEKKLKEIQQDIKSMKDVKYYNEVYQIKDSLKVMDNHYQFSEIYNIFKFLKENLSTTPTFDKIYQHLYVLLLQSTDVSLKEIEDINQLLKEISIEIKVLEFFKTFYYLHHKSIILSNYFLSRTKNQFNIINYYKEQQQEEKENQLNLELNKYLNNLSFDTIKNESVQSLFLKVYQLLENQIQEENKPKLKITSMEPNQKASIAIDDQFKFNFYFDIHFLLNIKDYDTIIKLIKLVDSSKLKNLNYLGFLNSMDLNDPSMLQLVIDFVKFDFFKNRLIVEHSIKQQRLDLIKLVLENNENYNRQKKIKRLSQDIFLQLFSIQPINSTQKEYKQQFKICEYFLSKQKDLVFNSLINKFDLFQIAFTKNNLELCKLFLKYSSNYVEIKIKDIKDNIENEYLETLEYFYKNGHQTLKNRIYKLSKKYYSNFNQLTWLSNHTSKPIYQLYPQQVKELNE